MKVSAHVRFCKIFFILMANKRNTLSQKLLEFNSSSTYLGIPPLVGTLVRGVSVKRHGVIFGLAVVTLTFKILSGLYLRNCKV